MTQRTFYCMKVGDHLCGMAPMPWAILSGITAVLCEGFPPPTTLFFYSEVHHQSDIGMEELVIAGWGRLHGSDYNCNYIVITQLDYDYDYT